MSEEKKVVICGVRGSNKILLSTAMLMASMQVHSSLDFDDHFHYSRKKRKHQPKQSKPKKVWYTIDSPEVKALTANQLKGINNEAT